jgi:hypothetical protein
MIFLFKLIFVLLLALTLFLAMSVGVAFGLVWIFPAISFEIGVLIASVSLSMIFYVFIKILSSTPFSPLFLKDDDFIIGNIDDEYDNNHVILPKSTRSRRKRR